MVESIRARTLLRVATTEHKDAPCLGRVDVLVVGWHPRQQVTIPLRRIPPELRGQLGPGTYLLAQVNLAAERARELHFSDFEAAPPPVPENELFS